METVGSQPNPCATRGDEEGFILSPSMSSFLKWWPYQPGREREGEREKRPPPKCGLEKQWGCKWRGRLPVTQLKPSLGAGHGGKEQQQAKGAMYNPSSPQCQHGGQHPAAASSRSPLSCLLPPEQQPPQATSPSRCHVENKIHKNKKKRERRKETSPHSPGTGSPLRGWQVTCTGRAPPPRGARPAGRLEAARTAPHRTAPHRTQRAARGGALTGGGRTLQMPVCSAMGRILWMKAKGSANSSQLGSNTGHSGGGRNSAMAEPDRARPAAPLPGLVPGLVPVPVPVLLRRRRRRSKQSSRSRRRRAPLNQTCASAGRGEKRVPDPPPAGLAPAPAPAPPRGAHPAERGTALGAGGCCPPEADQSLAALIKDATCSSCSPHTKWSLPATACPRQSPTAGLEGRLRQASSGPQ